MTHPDREVTCVQETVAGDVFTELFQTYARGWLAAARSLTGDWHGAEDLLQTVLVATLARSEGAQDLVEADAYVRRAMRNQHITWRRQRQRRSEELVPEPPEPGYPPLSFEFAHREDLWTLVKCLPAAQRATVVLRFYEDMTDAQTARALGCSVGTVKSNTSRGVQNLRRALGLRWGEPMRPGAAGSA